MSYRSQLIAHRGEMHRFTENTLPAIKAAVEAGARNVEFDIQLTRDHIPVLQHDFTLKRTTGRNGTIGQYTLKELKKMTILGSRKHSKVEPVATISTLLEIVELLNDNALTTAFVEIKGQSMSCFGMGNCVDKIISTMRNACFPWTLISFDREALSYAMRSNCPTTGWVLRHHTHYSRKAALKLRPDYIFCNTNKLCWSRHPFWTGPWRWVVYDIKDPLRAKALLQRGADMIETGAIVDMLSSPPFKEDEATMGMHGSPSQ
jgi:glycerophosphoryl diester phosphodiesterase